MFVEVSDTIRTVDPHWPDSREIRRPSPPATPSHALHALHAREKRDSSRCDFGPCTSRNRTVHRRIRPISAMSSTAALEIYTAQPHDVRHHRMERMPQGPCRPTS
jgi:hypothetical protein